MDFRSDQYKVYAPRSWSWIWNQCNVYTPRFWSWISDHYRVHFLDYRFGCQISIKFMHLDYRIGFQISITYLWSFTCLVHGMMAVVKKKKHVIPPGAGTDSWSRSPAGHTSGPGSTNSRQETRDRRELETVEG